MHTSAASLYCAFTCHTDNSQEVGSFLLLGCCQCGLLSTAAVLYIGIDTMLSVLDKTRPQCVKLPRSSICFAIRSVFANPFNGMLVYLGKSRQIAKLTSSVGRHEHEDCCPCH